MKKVIFASSVRRLENDAKASSAEKNQGNYGVTVCSRCTCVKGRERVCVYEKECVCVRVYVCVCVIL